MDERQSLTPGGRQAAAQAAVEPLLLANLQGLVAAELDLALVSLLAPAPWMAVEGAAPLEGAAAEAAWHGLVAELLSTVASGTAALQHPLDYLPWSAEPAAADPPDGEGTAERPADPSATAPLLFGQEPDIRLADPGGGGQSDGRGGPPLQLSDADLFGGGQGAPSVELRADSLLTPGFYYDLFGSTAAGGVDVGQLGSKSFQIKPGEESQVPPDSVPGSGLLDLSGGAYTIALTPDQLAVYADADLRLLIVGDGDDQVNLNGAWEAVPVFGGLPNSYVNLDNGLQVTVEDAQLIVLVV